MISAAPRRWPTLRPLATVLAASAAFLLFLGTGPAHAEKKMFGDVVVERGQSAPEVSTSIGDIEVLGEVEGDVKSASGDIAIYGPVSGNVRSGLGDVEITGPVAGRVEAGFGDVYIDSEVYGDVAVERGDVELGPRANVAGSIHHGSGQFIAAPSASFDGTMAGMASDMGGGHSDASELLGFIGWALAAAVFAAATVLATVVMPRPLGASARKVGEAPIWSLCAGLGSVVAAVVLFMVLLISGIGIPILILLAPVYLAFVFFGAMVVAHFVGKKVAMATGRYRAGNAFAAVVGAVILASVYFLPLGLLIFCLFALLGAGAALVAIFARSGSRSLPFGDRR